jgi:Asp-tRNA(Asn)/Glu-tRNA(Gln) amidotransferase C subunit
MAACISDDEVRRAAALAKLTLTESEIAEARGGMQDMLDAIAVLRSVPLVSDGSTAPQPTSDTGMRVDVASAFGATENAAVMHAVIQRASQLPAPQWTQSRRPPHALIGEAADSVGQCHIPDGRQA